jgi:hypothetical protein
MKTTLQSLQESISNAVDMIDQSQLVSDDLQLQQPTKYSTNSLDFTNANSLLDKCEEVTDSYKKNKPVIRVIHHLACSGGTLISKLLSSLPNTYLMSELHPTTQLHLGKGEPRYQPTDLISQARYAGIPDIDILALKIFKTDIGHILEHVNSIGGAVIIREHTHSDYCIGADCRNNSLIAECLKNEFDLLRVVTVRNPLDSYLSLITHGWDHFEPKGFNEYCRRYWLFLTEYDTCEIYKYEDILADPLNVMKSMALLLDLPFSEIIVDFFDVFRMSGDSGRTGDEIVTRDRRPISDEISEEVNDSEFYALICKRLKY